MSLRGCRERRPGPGRTRTALWAADQVPLRPSGDAWFFTLFAMWVFTREVLGDDSALWRAPAAVLGVGALWHLVGLIRQERGWRVGRKPDAPQEQEARAEGG